MLSEHEFVQFIREIYPEVSKLENKTLSIFNKCFIPGRGPTGVCGKNELDFTINLLTSTTNILIRLRDEYKLGEK